MKYSAYVIESKHTRPCGRQVQHAMQVVRSVSLSAFHTAESIAGLGTSASVATFHQLL